MKKLSSKRALVTGSGTGIGREIALEFARQGADVVLHYAHSEKGAMAAVEEIRRNGGKATAFKADLGSVDAAKSLPRQAIEFLGGLDILVNNAGITLNLPFEDVTPEQFDTLYNVNIRAQFFITQAALPALVKQKGSSVINITSIHAFEGFREHSVYAGTKGAIVSYTRELAIELAPRGVRVNAIAPGCVVVENYWKTVENFDPKPLANCIPAGFHGEAIDVAHVATFLASEESRFILGQTLIVDGGTTSWMPFNDGFKAPNDSQFGKGYVPGV